MDLPIYPTANVDANTDATEAFGRDLVKLTLTTYVPIGLFVGGPPEVGSVVVSELLGKAKELTSGQS